MAKVPFATNYTDLQEFYRSI